MGSGISEIVRVSLCGEIEKEKEERMVDKYPLH